MGLSTDHDAVYDNKAKNNNNNITDFIAFFFQPAAYQFGLP